MTFLQIGLLRPSVQLIPSPPKSRGTFADRCRASGLEALPTIGAGIPRQAEPFHGLSECVHTRVACYPRFRYAGSGWFPTVFPQGNGRVLVVHFRFSFLSFAPGTRRVHDHVPTRKTDAGLDKNRCGNYVARPLFHSGSGNGKARRPKDFLPRKRVGKHARADGVG